MTPKTDIKIFIVDDDSICRELCRRYLINMGFRNISLFNNGQDCIDQLGHKPDVILLDHNMPPMNGMETLKAIKKLNPDIFLIYISGQDNLEIAVDALKSGAFDYIIKGKGQEEQRLTEVMNNIMKIITYLSGKTRSKPKVTSFISP